MKIRGVRGAAPEILPGCGFVILESRCQDATDQCHRLGNLRKPFIVIGDSEHQTFSLWTGHCLARSWTGPAIALHMGIPFQGPALRPD